MQGSQPWVARRNHSLTSALWCQEVAYYYGEQIYSDVCDRDRMVHVLRREADLKRGGGEELAEVMSELALLPWSALMSVAPITTKS